MREARLVRKLLDLIQNVLIFCKILKQKQMFISLEIVLAFKKAVVLQAWSQRLKHALHGCGEPAGCPWA